MYVTYRLPYTKKIGTTDEEEDETQPLLNGWTKRMKSDTKGGIVNENQSKLCGVPFSLCV